MKRRYKIGDWFRIRLGTAQDAVGIITHGCRSRLFGYFFAIDASHDPTHAELKSLRAAGAVHRALFGGAGLEDARWEIIATSLAFDSTAWLLPQCSSRGAFGRVWNARTYDPQTLQIVSTQPIDEAHANALPDARFSTPEDLESALRSRMRGEPLARAQRTYEVRSPIDTQQLQLAAGACVQFSESLTAEDLRRLAAFIEMHPQTALRVHGFPSGFDAALLAPLHSLQHLTLDVTDVRNAVRIGELTQLQSLQVRATSISLQMLHALPRLRKLRVCGRLSDAQPLLAHTGLEELTLEQTGAIDLAALACAPRLQRLRLAYDAYTLARVRFPALVQLELHGLDWIALPDLNGMPRLRTVELRALRSLRDLGALVRLPALQGLRIEEMPQLEVWDLTLLRGCPDLRNLYVEIGSRSKRREIYRHLQGRSAVPASGTAGGTG